MISYNALRQLFQKFGKFYRIVHADDLLDSLRSDTQLRESGCDTFPNLLSLFAFRQIEFRDQFRQLLSHDALTVIVVSLDNLRLIGCMFHNVWGFNLPRRAENDRGLRSSTPSEPAENKHRMGPRGIDPDVQATANHYTGFDNREYRSNG